MGNEESSFELELRQLSDHPEAYDLGECEFHLAFKVDDFVASHQFHEEMGCICFENSAMGIYFIEDPRRILAGNYPYKKTTRLLGSCSENPNNCPLF